MTPSQSLVRYDNPVLVSRTDAGKNASKLTGGKQASEGATSPLKPLAGGPKKLPPVDDKGRAKSPTQTEDILNSILPPRLLIIFSIIERERVFYKKNNSIHVN